MTADNSKQDIKNTSINTLMLYILTVAKMVFPLIVLPYLTRSLSTDKYGMVAYVKAVMSYAQIIIDFGFLYSSVKDIVESSRTKDNTNRIIANTVAAKFLLSFISLIVVIVLCLVVPSLKGAFIYTLLSFLTPFFSCFLVYFFFRGIEKMHYITIVFVIMKSISTVLTILLVKDDADVLLIPIFDALSSVVAVIVTWVIVYKLGYRIVRPSISGTINTIRHSFTYFLNSVASTAFGALLTIVVGIIITDLSEVAYWSVCMQLVGAVQSLYSPIANGIYPFMIKNRNLRFIKQILFIFLPIVATGCILCYFIAPWILRVVGGSDYIVAAPLFRTLIPVLFISFPVAILGWPVLGPIEKAREMTISTVIGALAQFFLIICMCIITMPSLQYIAITRIISELVMLLIRVFYVFKFKGNYKYGQ